MRTNIDSKTRQEHEQIEMITELIISAEDAEDDNQN